MVRFVLCGSAWIAAWHVAPAATIAAALVYALLLAWPDRALGWAVAGAWAFPAWALLAWSDTDGPRWLWLERTDWTSPAGIVTAATLGPIAGAVAWLASRRHPEGAALRRRQHAEHSRKGWLREVRVAALPSSRRGRDGSAEGVSATAALASKSAGGGFESRRGDSHPTALSQPVAGTGAPAASAPLSAGAVAYGPRRSTEGSPR